MEKLGLKTVSRGKAKRNLHSNCTQEIRRPTAECLPFSSLHLFFIFLFFYLPYFPYNPFLCLLLQRGGIEWSNFLAERI